MGKIVPFRRGQTWPQSRAQLNQIVAGLNELSSITGDELIQIVRGAAGLGIGFSVEALLPKIPKLRFRWGTVSATWTSGNTVTMNPVTENGTDIAGLPNVTGYIISPTAGAPDASIAPVINAGERLAYIPFGDNEGVLVNVKWRVIVESVAGHPITASGIIDVLTEGTGTIILDARDWRGRVITYDIGWDVVPILTAAWANIESGVQVLCPATHKTTPDTRIVTKAQAGDSIDIYVDGTDGGQLKADIVDDTENLRMFYWCQACPEEEEACAGVDCAHCDDLTPQQYTIAVSDIVSCPCTVDENDANASADGTCTIDATFCVTQTADPCVWTNDDVGTITVNVYVGDSCAGEATVHSDTAKAILTRTAAGFTLVILVVDIDGGGGDAYAFDGGVVEPDCDTDLTIEDNGNCVKNFLSNYHYKLCENGTATVAPGC
ncbi:MAG: hypothetical protein KAJ19_27620 [Gammaproteobacteria bacterium]|nr:hypothetical protein [Gammaproteobacteria bacterium]